MNIKQIRLSAQGKEQLIRLKTKTGINQWNIVCRWAFCLSLREATPPSPIDVPADSNVEMTWPVFAGEYHELYLALLKERLVRDGIELSEKGAQSAVPAALAPRHRLPGQPERHTIDRGPRPPGNRGERVNCPHMGGRS